MRRTIGLVGLLATSLVLAGCGQEVKKENEQLKVQIAAVQKENIDLKGQTMSLQADAEALKKQVEELTRQKQEMEEQLRAAEAQAAARPGAKPPLKPRKAS